MASIHGGASSALDLSIDSAQSTLIQDFLDHLGITENAVSPLSVSSWSNETDWSDRDIYMLPDSTSAATATIAAGKQTAIMLNPDSETGKILIIQGSGDAEIEGGGGDDKILGGEGDDSVAGGFGDDELFGGVGNDRLFGGFGEDVLYGNLGDDRIGAGDGADRFYGGAGNDTASGEEGSDLLMGNRDLDLLYGNAGDDIIYGNQQDDVLYGGKGADTLYGGQDSDTLIGGQGNDVLHGNLGGDVFAFHANSGVDVIEDFVRGSDSILIAQDINGLSVATPEDLVDRISSDAAGNAVIDLGSGNVVTIDGLGAEELIGNIGAIVTVG